MINPYETPDEERGPLSETDLRQRRLDYRAGLAAWEALSDEERAELTAALAGTGITIEELHGTVPSSADDDA
jgi:hypothetical protein